MNGVLITHRSTDHGRDDVLPACETTLKNLQLEYLDLYLVHWPIQLRKECLLYKLEEDDKMGYDAQRIAKCWEVKDSSVCLSVCLSVCV